MSEENSIPPNVPVAVDEIPKDSKVQVLRNYINGEWKDTKNYIQNLNPATGEILCYTPRTQKEDVQLACKAAKDAFKSGSWSGLSEGERAKFLNKIADKIEENFDKFVKTESEDNGKPVSVAASVDIPRAIANFRFFAGAIEHSSTEAHYMGQTALNYTVRRPVGPCGLISPWNLPIYLLSWKVAPALACGNTVVCKPSELTPMTANLLAEIIDEVGLPKGTFNMVHGYGKEAGQAIVEDEDTPLISFTGGTATGVIVAKTASSKFKKLSLELGGKNSMVVFDDCDFEKSVALAVRASFANQGEICLCCSRIFIQETIYEKFLAAYLKKVSEIKVGDPSDSNTNFGSLISVAHRQKIEYYAELAKKEGGKIVFGGKIPELDEKFSKGAFYLPTVVTDLEPNSRTSTEEIFGPLVVVHKFKEESEVIEKVNLVKYGLCSSVLTSNVKIAHKFSDKLQVGMVWVNCLSPKTEILLGDGTKVVISDLYEKLSKDEKDCINIDNGNKRKTKQVDKEFEILTICDYKLCFADITGISKIDIDQKEIFEIETISGRKITCTGNHEFLTEKLLCDACDKKLIGTNGLIPAVNLEVNDKIAIFDRIGHDKVSTEVNETFYDIAILNLDKISSKDPRLPIIARLAGSILSDGSIRDDTKRVLFCVGEISDVEEIMKDVEKLGFTVSNYYKTNNTIKTENGKIYEMGCWMVETYTGLYNIFKSLGLPSGRRSEKSYEVPQFVMDGSNEVKREFVSAYYGGDGRAFTVNFYEKKSTSALRHSLENIKIYLSKDVENLASGRKFLTQIHSIICGLLKVECEVNIKIKDWNTDPIEKMTITDNTKIQVKDHTKDKKLLTLSFGKSYDLVLNFINIIGVRYCHEKEAQGFATREWIMFHNQTIQDIEQLRLLVLADKKNNLTNSQIVKKYQDSKLVNRSGFNWNLNTVHTWSKVNYQEKKLIYPTTAITPKEFFELLQIAAKNDKLISKKRLLLVPIVSITRKKPDFKYVYDISTNAKNHTFVANGFITHNCWLLRDLRVPFGGVKDSGIGREGGKYSLEFYSEDKNICINLDF